jgi:hypothetical protein
VQPESLRKPCRSIRRLGPYLLLELLLPGGTLLAVLLWLYSGAARGQLASAPQVNLAPVAIERVVLVAANKELRHDTA